MLKNQRTLVWLINRPERENRASIIYSRIEISTESKPPHHHESLDRVSTQGESQLHGKFVLWWKDVGKVVQKNFPKLADDIVQSRSGIDRHPR